MSSAPTPPQFPNWQDLTGRELSALPSESVAVMVVGAIEQHGAHLPLSTDLDIGEGLLTEALEHLPAGFPLVVLPPMAIGASDEHLSFPGTLSLSSTLATSVEGFSKARRISTRAARSAWTSTRVSPAPITTGSPRRRSKMARSTWCIVFSLSLRALLDLSS